MQDNLLRVYKSLITKYQSINTIPETPRLMLCSIDCISIIQDYSKLLRRANISEMVDANCKFWKCDKSNVMIAVSKLTEDHIEKSYFIEKAQTQEALL